jgi:hypothetical protein
MSCQEENIHPSTVYRPQPLINCHFRDREARNIIVACQRWMESHSTSLLAIQKSFKFKDSDIWKARRSLVAEDVRSRQA